MTTQQDERAELIRWLNSESNISRSWTATLMLRKAAAMLAADAKGGEEVARVVRDGATVRLEWASADAAHNARPGELFARPQQAAQVPLTDQATLAGLESAVGHLSRLFDEQLNMLIEVEKQLCVDGHYGPFEDGELPLCDRIRAHIAAHGIGKDQA